MESENTQDYKACEGRTRLAIDEIRRRSSWSQAHAELKRQEAAIKYKRKKIANDLIVIFGVFAFVVLLVFSVKIIF